MASVGVKEESGRGLDVSLLARITSGPSVVPVLGCVLYVSGYRHEDEGLDAVDDFSEAVCVGLKNFEALISDVQGRIASPICI